MHDLFETGDILVAATDVDDRNVDLRKHAGAGRILHFDATLQPKGELRTGQTGLVVGLGFDPTDRSLYACDPGSQTVTRFDRTGQCMGHVESLPRARIGSILCLRGGAFVAGLHSKIGESADKPAARLYAGNLHTGQIKGLHAEVDGGKFGFHCITHMCLASDERTLHYVSEGGRRLMCYDIQTRQQLPDLLRLDKEDPRYTMGPSILRNGTVLMATGRGALYVGGDGVIERDVVATPARGWSRLSLTLDQRTFYLGNFLEGLLEKRDVVSGDVLQTLDIQRKYSLSGLIEIPAP